MGKVKKLIGMILKTNMLLTMLTEIDRKCIRDSTGTGELLSRGRGTCMGYLNNR